MECPSCKQRYKFIEVPIHYRKMKALVTEFICPYCYVWLRPDRRFAVLMAGFVVLFIASCALFVIGMEYNEKAIWPAIVLLLFSIASFIYGKVTLRVEVINEI